MKIDWAALAAALVIVVVAIAIFIATGVIHRVPGISCESEYAFDPRPDISAYDLARIVAATNGPAGAKRICVTPVHPIPPDLLPQFRRLK